MCIAVLNDHYYRVGIFDERHVIVLLGITLFDPVSSRRADNAASDDEHFSLERPPHIVSITIARARVPESARFHVACNGSFAAVWIFTNLQSQGKKTMRRYVCIWSCNYEPR